MSAAARSAENARAESTRAGWVVRPFRDADEAAVTALWGRVFPDPAPRNAPERAIAHKRRVQPELFLVAERAGDVVGAVVAGDDGHRGWLHLLAVAPEARRRGIGAALVREAAARLRERGCPKLNLQVRGQSPDVVAFYESLGFAVEDRVSLGLLLEEESP